MQYRLELLILAIIVIVIGFLFNELVGITVEDYLLGNIIIIIGGVILILWIIFLVADLIGRKKV